MTYNISPNSLVSNSIYDCILFDYNKYIMRDIINKIEALANTAPDFDKKDGDKPKSKQPTSMGNVGREKRKK